MKGNFLKLLNTTTNLLLKTLNFFNLGFVYFLIFLFFAVPLCIFADRLSSNYFPKISNPLIEKIYGIEENTATYASEIIDEEWDMICISSGYEEKQIVLVNDSAVSITSIKDGYTLNDHYWFEKFKLKFGPTVNFTPKVCAEFHEAVFIKFLLIFFERF